MMELIIIAGKRIIRCEPQNFRFTILMYFNVVHIMWLVSVVLCPTAFIRFLMRFGIFYMA